MSNTKIISINIDGPVQSGKSAVLAEIHQILSAHGYCVAIPDREQRNNPSDPLEIASQHERPDIDKTVFVLTETTSKGEGS